MTDKPFTLITYKADGSTQEKNISIKKQSRFDRKVDQCQHNQVLVDEELWEINCSKCGEKLDPINYMIRLAEKEGELEYRVDILRQEYKRIQDILALKTKTKCEHCRKLTTINTEASIKRVGLLLQYVNTQKNKELNKGNVCRGMRDDGIFHSNHEFYLLREVKAIKIYVCKYCGQSVTEEAKR